MAYDALRQQVVFFGGGETWLWNGTNWTQATPTTQPSFRRGYDMAYDTVRQQVVLAGGDAGPAETWRWTGTDWSLSSGSSQTIDMRTRTNGVWNFTTIDIPAGITVKFIKNPANTPVRWLATGNVTTNGTLDLQGTAGGTTPLPGNEAPGGPGGFSGGLGGIRFDSSGSYAGTPGQGPGGGAAGVTSDQGGAQGQFASVYGNPYLQPLIGGSGGGGGASRADYDGGNGGGGGGAILIDSSRDVVINGGILAGGGAGGRYAYSTGGFGSGGGIRIKADRISGTGILRADTDGRIRLEAYYRPLAAYSSPIAVNSTPVAEQAFNTNGVLTITSVAGQNVVQRTGSTQTPDVIFSQAGPVTVTVAAASLSAGTPIVLRITANGQIIQATNNLVGTSTTFTVTVPQGVGTVQASATFTVGN